MTKLTPMMAQYTEIKAQYEDCILMFRLGDFYEMFFDDAVEAAAILQITLTARGKGAVAKAPMCGIPYHALDGYLAKLTRAGKKVALCDQTTKPDGTGIVQREVVRVVTPGTTFDEAVLDSKANNFVAALVMQGGKYGFSYSDVTTGEFKSAELGSLKELEAEIARVAPAELICSEELRVAMAGTFDGMCVFPFEYFADAENALKTHFELKSLKSFGLEGRVLATFAAAMLFAYLKETQKTDLQHVQAITYYDLSDFMPLDESCIRNLEIFYNNSDGKRDGSLIGVMDQTVTSMGGRMMRKWLLHPLLDVAAIEARHERVARFVADSSLLRGVREKLGEIYDIERLLSRLSLGTGNARDLLALKQSLRVVPELRALVEDERLHDLKELYELIESAIRDEVPAIVREGGMIKEGFNSELDTLLAISTEGKGFIRGLQEREIERTGISSMKVKYNKVFGYYIEISKSNLDAVPEDYIRKQTLVNAERYITPELKEYEEKVLNAEDRIRELEYELFYGVRMEIVKEIVKVQEVAAAVAEIDVVASLAELAVRGGYCKPVMGEKFEVIEGRHPVVEVVAGDFVPNDCSFEGAKFHLITGPNMGGKSTYLRQVALISLMAQVGSFVPAKEARLTVVDRIFTRVGASDNLAKGESTFMVEMTEAAYILHNASERSLVILDEIGRGTSTYDGVSIAWAIMEYVHDKLGAMTLFATHYHELVELADSLEGAANYSVAVRENELEGVVFLYKVVAGGVDKSYGIEVAKLAGLPVEVVGRARGVLAELETKHIKKSPVSVAQQELFEPRPHSGVEKELKELDLDSMTPMEAMQKLNEIKNKSCQ